jgi:hypothetical protein
MSVKNAATVLSIIVMNIPKRIERIRLKVVG